MDRSGGERGGGGGAEETDRVRNLTHKHTHAMIVIIMIVYILLYRVVFLSTAPTANLSSSVFRFTSS